MPGKKNFTSSDTAIERFFTLPANEQPNNTNDTNNANNNNITKHTNIYNQYNKANISKPTNKSKHYDERGKRGERFGLLLDERLKEDLTHLSKATGSKSVNDLIITVLLEYVEQKDNQTKLEQYRNLLGER